MVTNAVDLMHGAALAAAALGIVAAILATTLYRAGQRNLWRCMACRVSRIAVEGQTVFWNDLIELYRHEAGGMTPRFEEGRIIFADARSIIADASVPHRDECDRVLRLAQRSVPNTSQPADVEYAGNAFVMLILLAGLFLSIDVERFRERSWLSLLMTGAPCVFFLFYLAWITRQSRRVRRALNAVEHDLARSIARSR